jgi:hypothetical protein
MLNIIQKTNMAHVFNIVAYDWQGVHVIDDQ